MRKNKSFTELAILSFLAILLLITLLYGFCVLIGVDLNDDTSMNFLTLYIDSILFVYIPFIFICLCINISYKLGKKVVDIESGYIDLKKDKKYFMEILNNYGILELAYINNCKLEKRDILAAMLSLELKKVIILKNNQIVSVDESISITQTEEYLLRKCISGKVRIDRLDIITEIVKNDAVDKGLIEKETNVLKDIVMMFFKTNVLAFISIIVIVLLFYIMESDINIILNIILGLIISILICFCSYRMVYLVSYIIHKFKSYKLTNKGKKIKSKLEGLKLYIKEFSNLEDDNKDFITLWQEYLIYSVMFGMNDIIEKEMKDFIEIENKDKISKKMLFIIIFIVLLFFLIMI